MLLMMFIKEWRLRPERKANLRYNTILIVSTFFYEFPK
jgi:hypothetical protein